MPPQFQSQFNPTNNPAPENNPMQSTPLPSKPSRGYVFLLTLTVLLILTGVFGVWYFSNPLPEEETETLAIKDKFADWKTYRNEEYGFEIKYPDNLTFNESVLGYYPPCMSDEECLKTYKYKAELLGNRIIILQSKDYNGLLKDYRIILKGPLLLKENEDWKTIFDQENNLTEEIVGERKVFSVPTGDGDYFTKKFFIVNDNADVVLFASLESESKDSQLVKDLTNQILSTFKFISASTPVVDTSSWKTYRNEEYGFEIKYPLDWTADWIQYPEYDLASLNLQYGDSSFTVNFGPYWDGGMGDWKHKIVSMFGEQFTRRSIWGQKCGPNKQCEFDEFDTEIILCYLDCKKFVPTTTNSSISLQHRCKTSYTVNAEKVCLEIFDKIASTFKFTK